MRTLSDDMNLSKGYFDYIEDIEDAINLIKKRNKNTIFAIGGSFGANCLAYYLGTKNVTNKKIHFFIVAYGEEKKKWENLYMQNYLETTMEYLNYHKIIRSGTNGVYVLVTKSDNMPCPAEERKEFANRYIKEKMSNLYTNILSVCKKAGVQDFEILPFSVGDVFAQKICRYNSDNTDIVLDKLILKSSAPHSGFFGSIINWLNS